MFKVPKDGIARRKKAESLVFAALILLSLFWLIDTVYDTIIVGMKCACDMGISHVLEAGTHFVLLVVQVLLIVYVRRHVRESRRLERETEMAAARAYDEKAKSAKAEKEIRELNGALERRAADLAAKNRELEAFSYSLSHDLNTPLTKISVAVQALQDSYADRLDETGRFFIRSIVEGSERMEELIDAMLVLARIARRELRREEVDLSALAVGVVSDLRQAEPQRRVEPVITPGLSATGDPALLRVVLQNLFANAWKYTRQTPEPRVEFGAVEHLGTTTYYVRDNGAGFEMKDLDRLFKPFQRLHDQEHFPGTGIGLATVQRIVERHGGSITAHGVPDHGATFTFTLG